MAIGLLGRKLGMTHVYDANGRRLAVTAVQAGPCKVLRVRNQEKHGYQAVQVGFEPRDEKRVIKPLVGQYKSAGFAPFRVMREFRVEDLKDLEVGTEIKVDLFQENELVDVTGTSIGKGFQGGMKRWGWSGGPETHGSNSHRAPGSSGAGTTPGRVLRGHNYPGHMGDEQVTTQNARVIRTDVENNLILILGSIPGAEQGLVVIRKSAKKPGHIKVSASIDLDTEDEAAAAKKAARGKKKQ